MRLFCFAVILCLGACKTAPTAKPAAEMGSPVLDIEIRVTASLLAGQPIETALAYDLTGGTNMQIPYAEGSRDEGKFRVLPAEFRPMKMRDWAVRVMFRNDQILFRLNLPERPSPMRDWSEWMPPSAEAGYSMPAEFGLRYRVRLAP